MPGNFARATPSIWEAAKLALDRIPFESGKVKNLHSLCQRHFQFAARILKMLVLRRKPNLADKQILQNLLYIVCGQTCKVLYLV